MADVIDSYPLSPMQQGMLFHAVSEKQTGVDIEQIVITLHEQCDVSLFQHAWHEVIQRHTILRTRFRWEDVPDPRQEVVARAELPLLQVDWRELPAATREERFTAQLATDRLEDFDLTSAPMMRLFLARMTADEYRFVWTFHHALLDGRSFPTVLREVFALYDAAQRGEAAQLPQPNPYRNYVDWLQCVDLTQSEAHWRSALRGFHTPTPFGVDTGRAEAANATLTGSPFGAKQTRLSTQLTEQLREAARTVGVTVNTMLQAAWALLLHRYGGHSDIVFGVTRAGRQTGVADSENQVGLFINTLPFRVRVDLNAEITPWLQELRAQQAGVRAFEHTPLPAAQSWSDVQRGTPLFESLLVYEHRTLNSQLRALGGAWLRRQFEYIGQTNFPLTLVAYGDDEMLLRLEYSRRRFSDAAIERMMGHLGVLLAGLASGTAARLKDIGLLTSDEQAQLVGEPSTARSFARTWTLHERFEQQAARTPQAIALTSFAADESRVQLSYSELNARANALARRLRELGVVPNQLVGLRTERSAAVAIGILAILKAGGAYLPLDPVYPKDRIAFMLEDAGVRVVLTQLSLKTDLAHLPVTLVCLDEPQALSPAGAEGDLPALSTPQDLAYVIYTSGSTGKPKGVRITHHNVARLFLATDHWYGFNERDVWTLFHSYAFDFSVWELWGALLYGGRVVVVSLDISRNTEAFRELLVREAVTVLDQTPTAFRQLIDTDSALPRAALALRYVIFGGEALELQSLKPWFDRYGDTAPRLINMYGITETTVHVTYRALSRDDLITNRGSVIGEPIPDLRVYVLDANAQPVPLGVPGEMYVAGAGVALGYLNRPELTAQRFLPDPFAADPAARMYRSGDLARRFEDGELEYLGRIDQQVKIRGFRIELGEIEAVIAQHPAVRQVAVIDREDVPGEKRLAAYLVVNQPQPELILDLRERLRRALPDYMTPAHFLFVPALQLTPNGKLDRKALPAPEAGRAESTKPFNPPRNAIEQTIADVWQAVLRVERVGIDDHFFELGGDSILSIQVIARCRQQGLRLTPKDLFKSPTIARLAQIVTAAPSSQASRADPASGAVLLSPIQQWFFEQNFAQAHHWNQAFLFRVGAQFDPAVFERALRHVLRHHDALNLRYEQQAGTWNQQYAASDVQAAVQRVDLSSVPADRQAAAITEYATRAQTEFNVSTGPLLCAAHFTLGSATPGRVLLAIHHLVVDGVSWRVLCEDLESAYFAIAAGSAPRLADKTSSMQMWAQRLHEHAQTAAIRDSFEYWRTAGQVPAAELPPDASPAAGTQTQHERFVVRLSDADTRALLQQLPGVFRTQINDVLLCALGGALQRSIGVNSFRIDLEGHGREHLADDLDVSRTVGWFTALFPVALQIAPDAGLLTTLLAVRDQLRAVPHRGMSYGLLRYASKDPEMRDALAATLPASVLFNYLGQFNAVVADSKLFAFAEESTGPWRSLAARRAYPVEIISIVRDSHLEIEWHYDAAIHREATIARAADDMIAILRDLLALAASAPLVPFTPTDFPLANLDQAALTRLLPRYPQVQDIYTLTPMQRLFFAMEASQSNLGFEQWRFRIEGALDALLLRRAIEHVIARHTILRTAFVAEGGSEPLQIVSRNTVLPWSEEDWRGQPAIEQETRIAALLHSDAQAGFNLTQAPAMRIALRRVTDASWQFVWSTHHLCIDGWSWPLVFKDVSRAYTAFESGAEPALEAAIPFRDYLEWLATSAPRSEEFWKGQLSGFAAPTPFRLSFASQAQPRPQATDGHFAEVAITIPADITAQLQALARKEQLTLSVMLNGAWSLLLSHYSGSTNVVFGAAFSGRPAEVHGIESMIGPCVNNLPVRVDVAPDEKLASWLARLQQRQFEIAQHQYAPLEQIQQWADIPWRYRLFDSLIVFQNYQIDEEARRIGTAARTILLAAPEATNYALTLTVTAHDTLRVRFIHQPFAVAAADVQQFAADLAIVLGEMGRSGTTTLATLLGRLPAGLHGKANELVAAAKAPQRAGPYSAPTNEAERVIAGVWQELFGVDRVSLDDNFFELGGHSLLLVRAHAQLKERLQVDLPIVALLQFPTIRALARHLTGGPSGGPAPQAAIDRAQKQREAQQRRRTLAGRG